MNADSFLSFEAVYPKRSKLFTDIPLEFVRFCEIKLFRNSRVRHFNRKALKGVHGLWPSKHRDWEFGSLSSDVFPRYYVLCLGRSPGTGQYPIK
jgi:hypothetical protein